MLCKWLICPGLCFSDPNASLLPSISILNIPHLPQFVFWRMQIEKDIMRTGETEEDDTPAFVIEERRNALRHVLQCYCVHNRQVGYLQSMNVLVWSLLKVLQQLHIRVQLM